LINQFSRIRANNDVVTERRGLSHIAKKPFQPTLPISSVITDVIGPFTHLLDHLGTQPLLFGDELETEQPKDGNCTEDDAAIIHRRDRNGKR